MRSNAAKKVEQLNANIESKQSWAKDAAADLRLRQIANESEAACKHCGHGPDLDAFDAIASFA